jgi:23S rRNA (cytidine1920-2'-O)/16S rRNA (cytidine1409-2'-O)-methyltransferase
MRCAILLNLSSAGLLEVKRRIDQLLVERGLAESRQKAQALLMAGNILVGEQKIEKPGHLVDPEAEIRVLRRLPFASRAGAKLQAALDHFHISVEDRVCADLGASTGGFTDCLLQNGAREVYAFDVGKGQLAWKLRSDTRVIVRDECNVRNLTAADLPEGLAFVSIDLSFISVTKVLPSLRESFSLKSDNCLDVVVLVKPQFEVGRGNVGKGGIVRDSQIRAGALASVEDFASSSGYKVIGSIPSPVPGTKGNQEFLLYLQVLKGLLSLS